jgi:hypothetical protein
MRMKEITQTRVHYGYRRVHVLVNREGFKDNHKRIYRLYKAQGLSLRYKRPKRNKAAQLRQPKTLASHIIRCGAWTLWPTTCLTGENCACSPWWTAAAGKAWPFMLAKASKGKMSPVS